MYIQELVKDTVEYYKDHERGIKLTPEGKNAGCEYITKDGNRCAVGRCFNQLGDDWLAGNTEGVIDMHDYLAEPTGEEPETSFYAYLKPEYADISVEDFGELQNFHDTDQYWIKYKTKKGYKVSDSGKNYMMKTWGI